MSIFGPAFAVGSESVVTGMHLSVSELPERTGGFQSEVWACNLGVYERSGVRTVDQVGGADFRIIRKETRAGASCARALWRFSVQIGSFTTLSGVGGRLLRWNTWIGKALIFGQRV